MRAQEQQFKVGDKAVYPAQGVAEVVSIEEKEIAGGRLSFYVLRLLDTDQTIMVPVARANAVGLRKPMTSADVRQVFAVLREEANAYDPQTWTRRYRNFMETLKTGTVLDVAAAMRDLYRLREEKDLSFVERRMLDTARKLVVKEIAIARGQPTEKIQAEIDRIFEVGSEG